MDSKDKDETRQRALRGFEKDLTYEQRKEKKKKAAERRATHERRAPRRKSWSKDDLEDWELAEVRKTGRRREASPTGAPKGSAGGQGVVVSVARGRARVLTAGEERELGFAPEFLRSGARVAVGDEVELQELGQELRIIAVQERRSSLTRPDPGNAHRELCLAANVDVAVLVLSVVAPPLRPGLVDRFLVAVSAGGVAPAVCVNKVDLLDGAVDHPERAALEKLGAVLSELSVPLVRVSASAGVGIGELSGLVEGRTCVFAGHSGVGKSSLLNALDPESSRETGSVREGDGRGRHTTTSSTLRELATGTRIIDTPGVRAFGLSHLDRAAILRGFPEFDEHACRYRDCTHVAEPECGVRVAADSGELRASRYRTYLRLLEEAL